MKYQILLKEIPKWILLIIYIMNNALLQPKKIKSTTPSAKKSKKSTFARTDYKKLTSKQLKFSTNPN